VFENLLESDVERLHVLINAPGQADRLEEGRRDSRELEGLAAENSAR